MPISPVTSTRGASSGRARSVASTAADPAMSHFIVSMPSAVLSDSPPESKVSPLPRSATRRAGFSSGR